MCTVTFIPVNGKIFITSNRDEKLLRRQAFPPTIYFENCQRIIYPKDTEAGGSWIAVNEKKVTAVLLNGGFVKHESKPPYRKSRGIILLEIVQTILPVQYFLQTDLSGIEPFTIILFNNYLHQFTWTGDIKYCRQLDPLQSYIWSSATLYDQNTVAKRERWFADFLNKNPYPSKDDIFNFHVTTGDGDKQNDLNMDRDGLLSTVSITSVELFDHHCIMRYADQVNNNLFQTTMALTVEQFKDIV